MNVKRFMLSYYKDATKDFYITHITQPKEALSLHTHDYYQIYYVKKGQVVHHLQGVDGVLEDGDAFILPPNVPHYIQTPDNRAETYVMSFTADFLSGVNDYSKLVLDFLYYLKSSDGAARPGVHLTRENSQFVEAMIVKALQEFKTAEAGRTELIKNLVAAILTVLARAYMETQSLIFVTEENRKLVEHAIWYINHHYEEEITLAEMVRLSAMSKSGFCAMFCAITGTSFKNYLNRVRIEKAAQMLEAGQSVTVAGSRSGFGDLSTFYRNFKKYMGLSPREYAGKSK